MFGKHGGTSMSTGDAPVRPPVREWYLPGGEKPVIQEMGNQA